MSAPATVKAFTTDLEFKAFDKAASYLSDDFTSRGPTGQPVDKNEFMATQIALINAFPDLRFHLHHVEEQGDKVLAIVQITGTNTGDLVLPGMSPIPATSKTISLPEEHLTFTFEGDEMASMMPDAVYGNTADILQQIGVEPPQGAQNV